MQFDVLSFTLNAGLIILKDRPTLYSYSYTSAGSGEFRLTADGDKTILNIQGPEAIDAIQKIRTRAAETDPTPAVLVKADPEPEEVLKYSDLATTVQDRR